MEFILTKLDTTWKRVLVAGLLSVGIYFALQTFAESTYIQSQKTEIESAKQDRCQQWQYQKTDSATQVVCIKWSQDG